MTQIEKLKARHATATLEEARIIKELIATLSVGDAAPDSGSGSKAAHDTPRDTQDATPISVFCHDRAAAKMWHDLATGKAKAIVIDTAPRKVE